MIEFIFLFLHRVLSGVQNGFGYARTGNDMGITIVSAILLAALSIPLWVTAIDLPLVGRWLAYAGIAIAAVGTLGVYDNFTKRINLFPKDIHLWELLLTGGASVCWIALGGNLYLVAAHVYPALLLHKGAVNIGSGGAFWYHGTDDPSGQTFNVPLLNFRVPRLSLRGRQITAVVSLVGAAVVFWQGWAVSIYTLISKL